MYESRSSSIASTSTVATPTAYSFQQSGSGHGATSSIGSAFAMSGPATSASSSYGHHNAIAGSSSAFSPSSVPPTDWSVTHVTRWLQTLQPSTIAQSYAGKFREQGIEGDILLQLDPEALKELGVTSVGHRLVLLRSIYELKRRWDIEIEPDAWKPDVGVEGKGPERQAYPATIASVTSADLVRALHERDERVWALEQELARLVDWLRQCTDDSTFRVVEPLRPYLPSSKAHGSLPFPSAPKEDAAPKSLRHWGSAATLASTSFNAYGAPNSAPLIQEHRDVDDVQSSSRGLRGATASGSVKPQAGAYDREQVLSPYGVPATGPQQTTFSPTNSNTPSATPTTALPPEKIADAGKTASAATVSFDRDSQATLVSNGLHEPGQPAALPSSTDGAKRAKSTSADGNAVPATPGSAGAEAPYKSFRVTLDDPCYKVLPAALKKYKINDDWKQYALFICYGSTERCLSYDEKPLLLFQKLKENKQSPVFMLRHIRDVKSPIAIANAKAAARKSPTDPESAESTMKGSRAGNGSGSIDSGAGKVANAVAKLDASAKKEASSRTARNGKPADKDDVETAMVDSTPGNPKITGPASQLPDSRDGDTNESTDKAARGQDAQGQSSTTDTYAISIYPYVSEREDEFDVSVGDTFIVKSKAKGWWVVQRDVRADGEASVEGVVYNADGSPKNGGEIKSGWVPAGCLLETKKPLSQLVDIPEDLTSDNQPPASPSTPMASHAKLDGAAEPSSIPSSALTRYMAHVPIPPTLISSTSTEGVLLMDYNDKEEKIHLTKDQRLRVFKRYNHWSYCVEEGGNYVRAWLPSWYIGKVRDGSNTMRSAASTGTSGRERLGSKASVASLGGNSSGMLGDDLPSFTTGGSAGDLTDTLLPSTPQASSIADRAASSQPSSLGGTPAGASTQRSASPLASKQAAQTPAPSLV